MIAFILHAAVTLLVVIDPVAVTPLFASLTEGCSKAESRHAARLGVLVAAAVLYVFALAGEELLALLGIGLDAFRIAGGVLLFLVAIDMVLARQSGLRSTTQPEDAETLQRDDISVFPLGVPLIAGPGAIASVMLLMGRAEGSLAREAAVLAILALILALTYALLRAAPRVVTLLGVTGTNVIGRVLGIVLAALATQFIIDGVRGVMIGVS